MQGMPIHGELPQRMVTFWFSALMHGKVTGPQIEVVLRLLAFSLWCDWELQGYQMPMGFGTKWSRSQSH
jgi:hypothetical protein